ncbi:PEP-CTERM sorting domain-containing protein [Paracraurococcus ruber]|uniref:PEP-CTERM protein-sorting domain-containing protein n=1 Tax=Paracraurococcus ruber TaxID=77675 RepID=A0ABS1D1D2_9PROT|nr:PEP-CTERM sorting domain-containing protein [Paracraurococcus ruber]MBK1660597.1 hypothetical protein [Paracraurococcus ruber]
MKCILPAAVAALVVLGSVGASQAATSLQTVSIGSLPIVVGAGQSVSVALDPFARFDPAAGTLNAVTLATTITFAFSSPAMPGDFFSLSVKEPASNVTVDGLQGDALGDAPIVYLGGNTFPAPFGPQAPLFLGTGMTTLVLQTFSTRALSVTGFQATVTYDYTPQRVEVPAPASLAVLGAGLLGLAAAQRNSRRRKHAGR